MNNTGHIEIICGPMFSGKTEELIRRLKRAIIAKQEIRVFKPAIDTRYNSDNVVSHSSQSLSAIAIKNSEDILKYINEDIKVVGIDEIQFFDTKLVSICNSLANKGIRIICSGLDMDYKGIPFENTKELLAIAEMITKNTAICVKCGDNATRTQKLTQSHQRIEVGANDVYEARCRKCHQIL